MHDEGRGILVDLGWTEWFPVYCTWFCCKATFEVEVLGYMSQVYDFMWVSCINLGVTRQWLCMVCI